MQGIQLFHAARDGDTATVTTLLSSAGVHSLINTQDKDGYTPLYAAAANGHAPVTEQLIEARCDVELQETFGNTPLIIAAAAVSTPLYVFLTPDNQSVLLLTFPVPFRVSPENSVSGL